MADRTSPTRDYYDLADQHDLAALDESAPWSRWLPAMRVYGVVVLAVALVSASPWVSPGGWRGTAAISILAGLAVAFAFMWIYRPIWHHGVRTLAWHGLFLVSAYAALVVLSPAFVVLQLLIYPQVAFSLPLRWSIAGSLAIGAISTLVVLSGAGWAPGTALPGMVATLLTAGLVASIATWVESVSRISPSTIKTSRKN